MDKINVLSLTQSELDKRANKDKHDSTKLSKDMEFIGTLMEKREADSKDSTSLDTTETSSNSTKSCLRNIMVNGNNNSRQK